MVLIGRLRWLPLILGLLSLAAYAQEAKLEPGQSINREIAGGQSHTWQIQLTAGQFVHFRAEQKSLDCAFVLTAPEGKQLVEMDMAVAGEAEALSLEATSTGNYRLVVRGSGADVLRGSGTSDRQPVECQRQGDLGIDDEILREDAEAGRASGGSIARGAGRDVETESLAVALLLGSLYLAGRMEIKPCVSQ